MLLAMLSKAKIKCALTEFDDAKQLIRAMLPVAERDLEEDHHIIKTERYSLAKVLVERGQWEKAEKILLELIKDFSFKRIHHSLQDCSLERLEVMIGLFKCYRLQRRKEESLDLCHEILGIFKRIDREWHPLARKMDAERAILVEEKVETTNLI